MFGKLTPSQVALLSRAVADRIAATEAVFRQGIPAGSDPVVVSSAVVQAANDFAELNKMFDALSKASSTAKNRKKPGRKPKNVAVATADVASPVQADAQ